jgi:PAS domain S-box-containing protein
MPDGDVGPGETRQIAGGLAHFRLGLQQRLSIREPWWRYFVALLIFVAALVTRLLLDNELPPGLPFLTFFPAILANTYLAGFAVGIATLLASALAAGVLWLDPSYTLPASSPAIIATIAFLVIGALNVLIVHLLREERERSQALVASKEETELRLKTALEAAHLATWEYDLASGAILWDGSLRGLFGLPEGEQPSIDFFYSIVHPDDRARLRQLRPRALAGDASALASEFRIMLKDGSIRWLQIEGAFLPGPERRAAGVARDITRRKLADEQILLINSELKHRLRNLFAVVGSIFQQTLRTAGVPTEISAAVSGRLSALASTQELLSVGGNHGADLAELIQKVVAPLIPVSGIEPRTQRFESAGPRLILPANVSTSFALVLHELATNALKYGAWSEHGSVRVSWRLEKNESDGQQLNFLWQERDGPPVSAPTKEGLGTFLIQKALPGAIVEHTFNPSGLACSIHLPLQQS